MEKKKNRVLCHSIDELRNEMVFDAAEEKAGEGEQFEGGAEEIDFIQWEKNID